MTAKHGFDLTHFGTAKNWAYAAESANLKYAGVETPGGAFLWRNPTGLLVVTGNNPATGEYRSALRENDPGYASYIGIEGPAEEVKNFAFIVRNVAESVGEESPGKRSYI